MTREEFDRLADQRAEAARAARAAKLPACMGGWCNERMRCRRYLAPGDRQHVVERLCRRGQEMPEPVRVGANELTAGREVAPC